MEEKLISFLWSKGGWFLFLILLVLVIFEYERLGILLSVAYKWLGWMHAFFQKKHVAQDIESRINFVSNKLNRETEGLMPHELKVHWVKPSDTNRESFVQSNKIIMKMEYYKNQEKNLALVVHGFVKERVLAQSKGYMAEELSKSVDLTVAKKYLSDSGRDDALQYYLTNILLPELSSKPEVKKSYHQLEEIDELGLFTRIFLIELIDLAHHLYPQKLGLREVVSEVGGFVDYLTQFPRKPQGQDIDLEYRGSHIKVAAVLVAKRETFEEYGYGAYINRIEDILTSGFDTVYLMAMNSLRDHAAYIAERVCQISGVRVVTRKYYGCKRLGRNRKAVCIRIQREF
jgi:hypothetical protein